MYSKVKEIKALSDVSEVNTLLSKGWKLIEIYFTGVVQFVLARVAD